MCFVINIALDI